MNAFEYNKVKGWLMFRQGPFLQQGTAVIRQKNKKPSTKTPTKKGSNDRGRGWLSKLRATASIGKTTDTYDTIHTTTEKNSIQIDMDKEA